MDGVRQDVIGLASITIEVVMNGKTANVTIFKVVVLFADETKEKHVLTSPIKKCWQVC